MSEADVGRGLVRYGWWLGYDRSGGRLRWMSRWLQSLIVTTWNFLLYNRLYVLVVLYLLLFLLSVPHMPDWDLLKDIRPPSLSP